MDFALLPPEVNSIRMYTGPGSGALVAAADSWDTLAAELSSTAEAYGSILTNLAAMNWHGPAAEAMAATSAPYVGWLYATAEQTKQTAIQARAAVAAFEQAYAMTVPPPAVAANRVQLSALIATNFFGQNTAAIAATEAEYAEMWEQDAAAMYGYATGSAAATQLTPFSAPQPTANHEGLAAQSAAVSHASTAQVIQDPLSEILTYLSNLLSSLIPGFPPIFPENFTLLDEILAVYATASAMQDIQAMISGIIGTEDVLGVLPDNPNDLVPSSLGAGAAIFSAANPGSAMSGAGARGAVLASVGRAGTIGQLSVPASWAAPSTRTVAALSPAGLTTLPGTDIAEPGMAGVPGMAVGQAPRPSGVLPRYGVRLTVMAHPPAAG